MSSNSDFPSLTFSILFCLSIFIIFTIIAIIYHLHTIHIPQIYDKEVQTIRSQHSYLFHNRMKMQKEFRTLIEDLNLPTKINIHNMNYYDSLAVERHQLRLSYFILFLSDHIPNEFLDEEMTFRIQMMSYLHGVYEGYGYEQMAGSLFDAAEFLGDLMKKMVEKSGYRINVGEFEKRIEDVRREAKIEDGVVVLMGKSGVYRLVEEIKNACVEVIDYKPMVV